MQKSLISKENMFRFNIDTVLICAMLCVVGTYLGGITAFYQLAVCVASSLLCEFLSFGLILKKKTLKDLSALATGMIIAMLLPSSAPLWVGASASAFAILVAKFPFGDCRNAPFFPAAAGFCFAAIFFPKEVFTFPAVSDGIGALFSDSEGFIKGVPLIDMLKSGDSLTLNVFGISRLLSGKIPGAVGTVSLVALLGGLGYILVREPKRLLSSFGFILSAGLMAFFFPRINAGNLTSLVLELSAGSLIFVALIMINNPVNCPQKAGFALLYGFAGGIICMLLRYFSALSDPTVFTVLVMNALWPCVNKAVAVTSPSSERKESEING